MPDRHLRRLQELEAETSALRTATEMPYRAIVEDMTEMIVRWAPDGTRLFVNDAYCRVFGVRREDVIGTSFWPLVSAEDRERVERRIARLSPGSPVSTDRHRSIGPSGAVVWTEWSDRALFGPDGTLIELQSVGRDITERAAIEEKLREEVKSASRAHERFTLALEAAGMGVWEWDLDTGTTRWSKPLARVLGIDAVQATFGHYRELVHPDDREVVFRRLEQASRGGDALEAFELRMRRADGTWVHFAVTARIVRDGAMRVRRIVGALIDVTERRALEEGLRHAQKQEALGMIASGVAHDLNNLMNVILISTDVIREAVVEPSPRLRDSIESLDAATEGCVSLARQLLTFSRRGSFLPEAVDLGLLVTRLEPVLRRLARSPICVEARVEDHVGLVWADAGQCQQVLINLVVNARDALPERGTITVRAFRIDRGSTVEVALEVTDNGTGIDPATRARIFEPFFTTKEVGRGTGLGLAVVQSVAQRWRGRVEVESEPGCGSTFRVVFPRLPE